MVISLLLSEINYTVLILYNKIRKIKTQKSICLCNIIFGVVPMYMVVVDAYKVLSCDL